MSDEPPQEVVDEFLAELEHEATIYEAEILAQLRLSDYLAARRRH